MKYLVASYEAQVSTMGILKMQEAAMKKIRSNVGNLKNSNKLRGKINNMQQQIKILSDNVKDVINKQKNIPSATRLGNAAKKLASTLPH